MNEPAPETIGEMTDNPIIQVKAQSEREDENVSLDSIFRWIP